jgi:hypothetical protein
MAITVYKDGSPIVISPTVTAQNVTISVVREGARGPAGAPGEQGAPGPNTITTNTQTAFVGPVWGDAGYTREGVAGTDYLDPSNVYIQGASFRGRILESADPLTADSEYFLPTVSGKYLALTDTSDGTPNYADQANTASYATALQTARNIFGLSFDGTANVSGDATNAGHFASIPVGGTAGHFITLNGTNPTVIAGRSAWWSDSSGNPSFRNGTGAAVTLVKSSDLGTGVATALAVNVGSAGAFVTFNGALGTPSSGTLTNCTIPAFALTGTTLASNVVTSSLTSVGTIATGTWQGTSIAIGYGGTGSTSNTSVGALLYGTGTTTRANLAGNTSTTMAVLTQTGNGSASAAPVWTSTTGTGNVVRDTSPTLNNPTASTSSGSTAALIVSGPTTAVDTLQIKGTTTSSYSSIGLMDNTNAQRGSFGYGGSTAGAYASTVFFNATGGAPMTFGTAATERMRLTSTGEFGIGTNSPSTKALVDMTSTTKGFLPPRMTTTQRDAITSPPAGLMVYNSSTNKLNFYNGSAWEAVTSA